MKKNIVIAIDGPAGSGKSTTARLVAKKLDISYVDSGAYYRVLTLQFLRERIDWQDHEAVEQLLKKTEVSVRFAEDRGHVFLNGEDVTKEIRSAAVTRRVSRASEHPRVREFVTQKLRRLAENKSIVLEGRDIGTAVFPDAGLKIFMDASIEARAQRRYRELQNAGLNADQDQIKREIALRDRRDSERELAPLRRAEGAIHLDNTNLTIEQGVDFIVREASKLLVD